jgi:predicted RNase H-like HicB family nuclease
MARGLILLVEEAEEGGYTARALGESIYTQADTWEELRDAVQDATRCHFDEKDKPSLLRLHFVREEVLAA